MAKVWTFNPPQLTGDVEEPEDLQGFPNAIVDGIDDAIEDLRQRQRRPWWRRRSFVKFFWSIVITSVFMGVWSAALMGFGYLEEGNWLLYQHLQRHLLLPGMGAVWLFSVIVAKLAGRL